MTISIPKLSLVVLIGPSGSGKSTFAHKHFLKTEILSSDYCRGLVSDDENDQAATNDAFDVLHFVASKRLAAGKLTVVDATNVQPESRRPLVRLAREFHVLPVAIVLNLPEKICNERNRNRPDRNFGHHVIRQQRSQLHKSVKKLKREGFRHVFEMESPEEVETATIERVPLWNDRRELHGPFDIIGDIHGCCDELELLLDRLGYVKTGIAACDSEWSETGYSHPDGRRVVFVGDLVDRGPRVVDTLRIAMGMVASGSAICVPGNHDVKLLRKLMGKDVRVTHGLAESLADIASISEEHRESFRKKVIAFIDGLVSHYVFDDGNLVVAHAGMKQEMQGRGSGKVREFALYGETTGETDEYGLPIRHNWAAEYRGPAMVVYGHTPVPHPEWLNHTINIDTGCVFGGKLTALRYPELELVQVEALKTYCETARPFLNTGGLSSQQMQDDLLDASDVIGKRIISTRLRSNITIREENGAAALEVISRFAINPKWLIHLPPTMSPCATSSEEGYLEFPTEAFDYFRSQGSKRVICEEKHMGSRAIVVVSQNVEAARQRFGIQENERGAIYTRTGRRFFNDTEFETAFLDRIAAALTRSGFWEKFQTTWVCLDCELMPWSAKAQELLRAQYAAVSAAGCHAVPVALSRLEQTAARIGTAASGPLTDVFNRLEATRDNLGRFRTAWRQYCWKVDSLDDFKLAPFHLLATEGAVHSDRDHHWHMSQIAEFCHADDAILMVTRNKEIDLADADSVAAGVQWWLELTGRGGEGMVVKPIDFVAKDNRGLIQPAVKCRGREYLRIIYGPDYDTPVNLHRLRNRHLGRKQSLAIREFALGIESLERFVRKEPLRRIHECVFGVLALESEPVDPRL